MKSATTLYLAMILGCVLGLWGIMHLGRDLQAPPDLRGEWELVDGAGRGERVSIEQSGEFAQVTRGDGPATATRIAVEARGEADGSGATVITLTDGAGVMRLVADGEEWRAEDGTILRSPRAEDVAGEGGDGAGEPGAGKGGATTHLLFTLLLAVAVRDVVAGGGGDWHPHEYAGADGTGDPEHRT